MEIYDLSFNTVLSNVQTECTSFFCPRDCKFMRTIVDDLDVQPDNNGLTYKTDSIFPGRVYKQCPVRRLPTVYVRDTETYCDVTLLFLNDKFVQAIIMKYSECPDIVDIDSNYDHYKVYYEYVGGIADLKSRVNFEHRFMRNIESNGEETLDELFKDNVDEQIIKKMFE